MKGTNHEDTRKTNLAVVFETIRQIGNISRVQIAKISGLRGQTITNLTRELLDTGIIVESGKVLGKRGQPQTLLDVDPNAAFSIGIQIDKTSISGCITNLNLQPINQLHVDLKYFDYENTFREVIAMISMLLSGIDKNKVWGLGVAVANLVDYSESNKEQGSPGWELWNSERLILELSRQTGLRTFVENDATAAAIGCKYSGQGKNLRNFVHLYIGNGIGSGIIVNNQPYKGSWNNAGEVGRIFWPANDQEFLEDVLSIQGLSRYLSIEERLTISSDHITKLCSDNNPDLLLWVSEASCRLKFLVNIIENTLQPESIVISSRLDDCILDKLLEMVQPLDKSICDISGRSVPRILTASNEYNFIAIGAASLPMYSTCCPKLHGLLNCSEKNARNLVVESG